MAQELKNKQNTVEQTPIEIALAIDERGMTTAWNVYQWLELDKSHFTRWCKQNILGNDYAEENVDYIPFTTQGSTSETAQNGNFATDGENSDSCGFEDDEISESQKTSGSAGRPKTDYYITANFAKKLCMASHSPKGEEARQYFLGCESALAAIAKHGNELIQKQFARLIQGYNNTVVELKRVIKTSEAALETVDKVNARVAEVASGETVTYSWSNSAYERVRKIGEQHFPGYPVKEVITKLLDEMNIVLDPYIDAYKVTHPNEKSIYRLRVIGFFDELIYPFEKCLKKYEQEIVPEEYDAIAMGYAEWEENQANF